MRVTAQLFNPPGRGEFLQRQLTAPDSTVPTTPDEFALRSVRAMKHFWPGASTPKATQARRANGCVIVSSDTWQVTWELSSYATERDSFLARLANGEDGCNQELLDRAAQFKE